MEKEFLLLKELSEAAGVPGREENIRKIVMRELKGAVDSLEVDALGCVIAHIKGSAKKKERIMFAAHMDEIGFMVNHIDDRGFLRIQELGGFDTRQLFSKRVLVHTSKGAIPGIISVVGKPLHISSAEDRKGEKQISDLFIDLGLPGKKVQGLVQVGDPVTLDAPCIELGDYVCGKCLDNRVQVYVGITALKALKKPKNDIYGVFTVQEEVGLRGAFGSSYYVEPTIGICLDTTIAADTPGIGKENFVTTLGGGAAIKIMDGSVIADRGLVDSLVAHAKKGKIPYQLEILPRGGTDSAAIQRSRRGVKTAAISVPTRYIHTTTESVHKKDVIATRNLLKRFLEA